MARKKPETEFCELRRRAIELDFMRLNDMQRSAVLTTEGPLLLLAGAGSGKTTVLINRIANLMRYGRGSDSGEVPEYVTAEDAEFLRSYIRSPSQGDRERMRTLCALEPCEPWRIIAITFTNKAADELKQRLSDMLGPEAEDIWAMTFHSACVRILRRDIDRLGFDRSFTIYDTTDSQSLVKRIIKELDLDDKTYNYRSVLGHISRAKDAMVDAEAFYASASGSGDLRRKNIARIYVEYSNRMKAANALDFDDIILFTVRLLLENDDIREYYQRRFRYVLIDEYQDTNHLQYLFAHALAGGSNNICVVGDDDQSIYKFRGATIENILSFETHYKGARLIRLEQNYRSTGHILAAANSVIKNNVGRKGKNLWTEREMGDKPVLHTADDERAEAQFVAGKILSSVAAGENFRDTAVLYRMNAQSNQLEYAFKRSGIPYRVIGGTKFFDRAEVKDMLAYLCVIANPADDLRLLRIINQPARGIGQATIDTVSELAAAENRPVYDILLRAGEYDALKKSAGRISGFTQLIEHMRGLKGSIPLDALYDELIERTGYVRTLEAKQTDENLNRIENVSELKTNIATFIKETEGGTLEEFLDEISLYTDIDQYDRSTDCVSMMTMHSAKGLEFDTVFLVGMEEGIFPGSRSIGEPDEMEEERRLCYVGMTRAKKHLYFTNARHRMLFGKTTAGKLSRFIEEIDSDNIELPVPAPVSYGYDFGADISYGGRTDSSARGGYSRRPYDRDRDFGFDFDYPRPGRSPAQRTRRPKPVTHTPVKQAKVKYAAGDRVVHKAFGPGVITKLQPTGNDALVEVEFEKVGTKRLMLNSAANYMSPAGDK